MNTEAEIGKEIDTLLNESTGLLKLLKKEKDIMEFGNYYQNWYTRALKLQRD